MSSSLDTRDLMPGGNSPLQVASSGLHDGLTDDWTLDTEMSQGTADGKKVC